MEGLTSLVSGGGGDGGMLSKILPWIMGGSAVAGTAGNIGANRSRNAVLKQQMDYTKQLQNMTPAQVLQGIQALQQPLSSSLVNGVSNVVSAKAAERGLSQAPGIFNSELAQGLAPYQLQEQQLAQDAFFKKLGLPISSRPSPFGPFPNQTNTSQIFQTLAQRFMGNKGSSDPFNYWAANHANPFSPGLGLPDLSNVMPPDMGTPDWLSQLSSSAPPVGG